MAGKLNDRQKRFCDEYLIDLNATRAAIRAGYSSKTAEQLGYKLVQKSSVQEYLQVRMKEREKRTGITADRILEELAEIGLKKAGDYTDADLKYSNKIKALELLGKHLGLWDKKSEAGEVEDLTPLAELLQDE